MLAALEGLSELSRAWGSNSWVLAPEKTASGGALLANDPHIGFTNPSIWYEAHVQFEDFESYGYHLPLIPIPLISHNEDRAWSLTMFANDDVDLYRETFKEDDPTKVRYRGEWRDVTIERETIKVRFGADVEYEVRVTPHGPVITDLFRALGDYEGDPVALRWVWQHVPYTDLQAFYQMGHARNLDDFEAAVALVTSPGVNVSYADAEDNIAWWAAGRIAIRPPHVHPKFLLDGASGEDEVLGYVPFEENPHLRNPPWGYIVTANNMSTVRPVGEAGTLQGYWQPGDRAARIEEILEQRDDWTPEATMDAMVDSTAWGAPRVMAPLWPILDGATLTPFEQEVLNRLREWDFRHEIDSVGATIYQYFTDSLLVVAAKDEIGEDLFALYGTLADHWNFLKYAVNEPELAFWDDVRTEAVETRDGQVVAAWQDAVEKLRADLGDQIDRWEWGPVHTITFKHPLGYLPVFSSIFNIGPFPVSGGAQIVNNLLYPTGAHDFSVIAGPSTRRVVDFGDIERAYTILPTGNSGHVMSRHYDDQAPLFAAGEYRQVYFTDAQVEAHAIHEMRFVPAAE